VVRSLEASLWAFAPRRSGMAHSGPSTSEMTPIRPAPSTGQLAGAFYGERGIPEPWRARLALRERIIALADQLWTLAGSQS
jgi:ADP-ribosyl-[dinitrogen reductase] hydrolase